MSRRWALLALVAACGRKPSIQALPEGTAPSDSSPADLDELAGVGVDLASCLAGCTARAYDRLDELATPDYTLGGQRRIHPILDAEVACREKCLTDYRSGLLCEACAREMERAVAFHECVGIGYTGNGQKCRWSFPERTLELKCCFHASEGTPPHEVSAATPCPSSGTCSQAYE